MRTIVLAVLATPVAAQMNPTLSKAERGIGTGESPIEAAHLRIDSPDVIGRTADVTVAATFMSR